MTTLEAIQTRHAVRQFKPQPIPAMVVQNLQEMIQESNQQSQQNIQLFLNEPQAFSGLISKMMQFKNADNYLAVIGSDEEKCGYNAEKLVLWLTQQGLQSCWVSGTLSRDKSPVILQSGQTFFAAIALGHGQTTGVPHKSKPVVKLYQANDPIPDWFQKGVEAAALAPTALNKQNFKFLLADNQVTLQAPPTLDRGIVKYHFEIGAADADWSWAE